MRGKDLKPLIHNIYEESHMMQIIYEESHMMQNAGEVNLQVRCPCHSTVQVGAFVAEEAGRALGGTHSGRV